MMNFIITGLLVLTGAVGFQRAMKAGEGINLAPVLISLFGIGTVIAGLFPPDAGFGFPPGAPKGAPPRMSFHGLLHGVGFDVAFLSLIVVAFLFARRFHLRSQRGWRLHSTVTGTAIPLLIVIGIVSRSFMGIAFLLTALLAFSWLSVIAARQRAQVRDR
jgi:Protein of unknown function (DUF998)